MKACKNNCLHDDMTEQMYVTEGRLQTRGSLSALSYDAYSHG